MNNIETFGFSVVQEKANYPWASPEAAIESIASEYFVDDYLSFDEFDAGTEGIIGDAWNWLVNLVKRFWNWITGNKKKTEKVADNIVKQAETSKKLIQITSKLPEASKTTTQEPPKEDKKETSVTSTPPKAEVSKEFDKFMNDKSQTLKIGADDSKEEKLDFYAPDVDVYSRLTHKTRMAYSEMFTLTNYFEKCSSWKDATAVLVEHKKNIDEINKDVLEEFIKEIQQVKKPRMLSYPIENKEYCTKALDKCILYATRNKEHHEKLTELAEVLHNKFLKFTDVDSLDSNVATIKDTLIKLLTQTIPKFIQTSQKAMTMISESITLATKKNQETADKLKDGGVESVDIFGFTSNSLSNLDFTSEGFESICNEVTTAFSNLDALLNQHYNEDTFFGLESDEDSLLGEKLPFKTRVYHSMRRAWDAVKRFFLWIGSFFSDKMKEKHSIEKMRAELNKAIAGYDYIESVESATNMFDLSLMSGLESVHSLTLTDYKTMNENMYNILEYSEDLAKFTQYFINMVTTGKANRTDFQKHLTPGLKSVSQKLASVKFPGTVSVEPNKIQEHGKEANKSLDYCKEIEKILSYMSKNKTKIDKFFDRPELSDNELAKEMIASLSRYYIPAMKQLTSIFQWYTRCIESDIKKIKNNK